MSMKYLELLISLNTKIETIALTEDSEMSPDFARATGSFHSALSNEIARVCPDTRSLASMMGIRL